MFKNMTEPWHSQVFKTMLEPTSSYDGHRTYYVISFFKHIFSTAVQSQKEKRKEDFILFITTEPWNRRVLRTILEPTSSYSGHRTN